MRQMLIKAIHVRIADHLKLYEWKGKFDDNKEYYLFKGNKRVYFVDGKLELYYISEDNISLYCGDYFPFKDIFKRDDYSTEDNLGHSHLVKAFLYA